MSEHTGHGPWPCQDPGCPEWARPSGIERVRLAIARDRGAFAPSGPVTLCGVDDGTARRADSWEQPGARLAPRQWLGVHVGNALICPGCLAFRFGPVHLMIRLTTGRH